MTSGAADVAVDGALLISGGSVLFLFGDFAQVGEVILGRHRDRALPEPAEGRVSIEDRGVLRVDVEDVELAGPGREPGFDSAKEFSQKRSLEGMEEKSKGGGWGEIEGKRVALDEADGREELLDFAIVTESDGDVSVRDVGEGGVELHADDFEEGRLGSDEHGAAFAGTDIEKGIAIDGEGR